MAKSAIGFQGAATSEPIVAQTVRLPQTLHRRVLDSAKQNRRSFNSEVMVLLEKAL